MTCWAIKGDGWSRRPPPIPCSAFLINAITTGISSWSMLLLCKIEYFSLSCRPMKPPITPGIVDWFSPKASKMLLSSAGISCFILSSSSGDAGLYCLGWLFSGSSLIFVSLFGQRDVHRSLSVLFPRICSVHSHIQALPLLARRRSSFSSLSLFRNVLLAISVAQKKRPSDVSDGTGVSPIKEMLRPEHQP